MKFKIYTPQNGGERYQELAKSLKNVECEVYDENFYKRKYESCVFSSKQSKRAPTKANSSKL